MNLAYIMEMTQKDSFGDRVREARNAKGLTQTELAAIVGLSQQSIVNIERKNSVPNKLYSFAQALGVTEKYLITGDGSQDLALVQSNEDLFTIEKVQSAIPDALSATIKSVYKTLAKQGQVKEGVVDIVSNRELIESMLIAALTHNLTGEYMVYTSTEQQVVNK